MLGKILNLLIRFINFFHDFFLSLNDNLGIGFSDKQLHFIFIGVIGLFLLIVIYPIFNWLAKNKSIMSITWIYVLTIMIVFTLAIEVGQKISGGGDMDSKDIAAGLLGYFIISAVYIVGRKIYLTIKDNNKDNKDM